MRNILLKVVAYDSWISYYVNDTLVASTGDYTLQKDGQKDRVLFWTEGSLGLLNWNGEMTSPKYLLYRIIMIKTHQS